jgi:hypothetical protein
LVYVDFSGGSLPLVVIWIIDFFGWDFRRCSRATRFAKRRSDAAGKSIRSRAEPPSQLLCRARGGVLRPGLPRRAREKWTLSLRLRWSQRKAVVKNRGSERCEGTRVRSTASPFARQVEGGPRGTARAGATPRFLERAEPDKGTRFDSSRPLEPCAEAWSGRGDRRSGSSTPSRVTGAPPPAQSRSVAIERKL